MTLTELRYIVAVARERHFGRAAEACFVSQPTLSVAVKKLEQELGLQLFERGPGEVTVTPTGQKIVAQAQRVLEEAARIKDLAAAGRDPLAGPLRLGAIYTIGPYLLPKLIPILRRAAPQMQLHIQENFTHVLAELLKNGEVDVILIALPFAEPGIETRAVYDEPFMVAVPKGHAWDGRKRPVSSEELTKESLLLLGEGHCFRDQVLDICHVVRAKERSPLARTVEGGSLETIRQMVAGRRGRDGAALDFRRRQYVFGPDPRAALRAADADAARRPRLAQELPAPRGDRGLAQGDPRLQSLAGGETAVTERGKFWWTAIGVSLFAFVTAAAFSAYLKPGMLIELANLILCS